MEAAFSKGMGPADMEAAFGKGKGMAEMEAAFENADMEAAFNAEQTAQDWAQEFQGADWAKEMETQSQLASARQMVDTLRSSGNPKFMNSQFVQFIDQVGRGELSFQDNKVVDRQGKEIDWDTLYNAEVAGESTLDAAWEGRSRAQGDMEQAFA